MNNELYHHGILGQKWGQRNGPPYPLSSQSHSSSEKKAGWRKSLASGSESSKKKSIAKKATIKKSNEDKKDGKLASIVKKKASEALQKKAELREQKNRKKERAEMLKNRRSLSDEDVKRMINRLQDERRLKELTERDLNPGKYAIKGILADAGKSVATDLVKATAKYAIRKHSGEKVTGKDFAEYFKPSKK